MTKRVSTVAVFHNGKLLMGLRRDKQKWTTPGGHLEVGEDPLAGAARELYEEAKIRAQPKELKLVGDSKFTRPDGVKMEVYAYRLDLKNKPSTSMQGDPDQEVHRWRWIDVRRGLPAHIVEKLHVPFERNVLLKGLKMGAMEKTAFWIGFEKQAMLPLNMNPIPAGKALAKSIAGKAVGAVAAHPKTALGAGAALGGFAAGRMSKSNGGQAGPRYPY